MVDVVLFDLDGTVSDSAPGILAALRHAFRVNGIPPLDTATERTLLGPPFQTSLPPLIGTRALDDVIAAYREHYGADGMFDTRAYPGIEQVLRVAQGAGCRLAIATSKPERFAVPIVEFLGLGELFETVGGDEFDGSLGTKALVIDKVLGRLGRPDPASVLMVGDREHDVFGARTHGIDCIGAGWGYAAPGELQGAGARAVCTAPLELPAALGLPGAGRPGSGVGGAAAS